MATGKIKTLFSDIEKTEALFPRTKVSAVSDADGTGLDAILDDLNSEISTKATESFVANKIAEAQLSGGSGGNIDLSGYATKDDIRNIDFPVDSVNGKTGAVTLAASDVGARPSDWMPTAEQVGARANTWLPTIAEIGAAPSGLNAEDVQSVTSNDALDSAIATAYNSTADNAVKFKTIGVNAGGLALGGGVWQFVINRSTSDYGIIYGVCYNQGGGFVFRVLHNGSWGDWQRFYPSNFAPSGYGLGDTTPPTITTTEQLDATFTSGFYRYAIFGSKVGGIGLNFGSLIVYTVNGNECVQELRPLNTNCCLRRYWYNGSWSEWEVENPPMSLGVEYRTTERWNDKPVYTMLADLGATTESISTTISASGITALIRAVPIMNNAVVTEWDKYSGANQENRFYFCPERIGSAGVGIYISCGTNRVGKNLKAQIWYTK